MVLNGHHVTCNGGARPWIHANSLWRDVAQRLQKVRHAPRFRHIISHKSFHVDIPPLARRASEDPTLLMPRSNANPLDDACQDKPIFPATELKRISANRLR